MIIGLSRAANVTPRQVISTMPGMLWLKEWVSHSSAGRAASHTAITWLLGLYGPETIARTICSSPQENTIPVIPVLDP